MNRLLIFLIILLCFSASTAAVYLIKSQQYRNEVLALKVQQAQDRQVTDALREVVALQRKVINEKDIIINVLKGMQAEQPINYTLTTVQQ